MWDTILPGNLILIYITSLIQINESFYLQSAFCTFHCMSYHQIMDGYIFTLLHIEIVFVFEW